MKTDNPTSSRRQWFTGLLRGGLLAAFGAASVHLLSGQPEGEENCSDPKGRIGCRTCMDLSGCQLPRALSVKQFLRKRSS
jgi:hypothetical protein